MPICIRVFAYGGVICRKSVLSPVSYTHLDVYKRQGLLLPHLEGIDDPKEQIAIAKQKAGIGAEEPVEMERFEVVRYT